MNWNLIVIVLAVLMACNQEEKKSGEASQTSAYSPELNHAFDSTLKSYYALSEILVNWDSAHLEQASQKLKSNIDQLSSRIDTATGQNRNRLLEGSAQFTQVKKASEELLAAGDITAKRHTFHLLSENLFTFLEKIHYDRSKVYLMECTMPFNDTGRGVWLSATEDRRNPYLGLHHPYYKAGMLECGTTEGSIDFTTKEN